MQTNILAASIAAILCLATSSTAFSPSNAKTPRDTSLSYITDKASIAPSRLPVPSENRTHGSIRKPMIEMIRSLGSLQFFLELDDRPVAIKFYAPWCKTCKRLGLHYDRLAMELGDSIVDRKKMDGQVRFAAIEYGSETAKLITETLQVPTVPTLQVYSGTHKLWEQNGAKTVTDLKGELARIRMMSTSDLERYAEDVDDHILEQAIDESLYDAPDFLNEEW